MKTKTKKSFANVRKVALFGVVCVLLFAVVSCEKAKEEPQQFDRVTGTIIGVHYGFMNTFYVQVDSNYPIGKPIYTMINCAAFYSVGFFSNVITIQQLDGIEILENWRVVRTPRISFSYREFNRESVEDKLLFRFTASVDICHMPPSPWYVVTEFQLLD